MGIFDYKVSPYLTCEEQNVIKEIMKKSWDRSNAEKFDGIPETKSADLPEKHRCICSPKRALELLRGKNYAGVLLDNIQYVLARIQNVRVVRIYNLDTHGVVFILHK